MAKGGWFRQQGLRGAIPGTTGRKIPGAGKLPTMTGGFMTNVTVQPTSIQYRERQRVQIRDSRGQFGGGWGYAWNGLNAAANEFQDYMERFDNDVERAVNQLADDMLAYAKANAPWQDHPGVHEDARENLQARVVKDRDGYRIFLGHGKNVYYGIWLEVRWGGKYAIITPTVMKFAPQMRDRILNQT